MRFGERILSLNFEQKSYRTHTRCVHIIFSFGKQVSYKSTIDILLKTVQNKLVKILGISLYY